MTGPALRFDRATLVCVTGAADQADGRRPAGPLRRGRRSLPAGAVLDVGPLRRTWDARLPGVAGGLDVPPVLGSRSTFLLGGFGGLDGRALADGDVLPLGRPENLRAPRATSTAAARADRPVDAAGDPRPARRARAPDRGGRRRVLRRRPGRSTTAPTAPASGWSGRRRGWARTDGGEAGLHPSNMHDSAYPVGGIMLSGDTPVIVGPDGPWLGGFVVPAS